MEEPDCGVSAHDLLKDQKRALDAEDAQTQPARMTTDEKGFSLNRAGSGKHIPATFAES